MLRKVLGIVCACILAAGLTVGCGATGKSSESADTGGAQENAAVISEAAETQKDTVQSEKSGDSSSEEASSQENNSVMSRKAEGQTIVVWGWDLPEFNKKIEDYVKEASGVTVNGQTMAREDEVSKLTVAAATGNGLPDGFKLGNEDIPRLVAQNAIRDITDLVEPYKDCLPQVAWDMVTYEGKIWGIPANSPAGGMFYRYDVLEKYGINPEELTTWDKWLEAGKKVVEESNGEVMWFNAPKNKGGVPLDMTIFPQYGAQLPNSHPQVAINSQNYKDALSLLQEIRDAKISAPIDDWSAPWYQSMKDGTVACYGNGTWFVQTLIQQAPDTLGKWYFTPFPAVEEGGDRYPNFGSTACFISSQTKNVDAAFEWCKAWTLDEKGSLEIGLKELGVSVVSNAALENEYVNQPHEFFAKDQAYWKLATQAFSNSTYVPPFFADSSEADSIWQRYYEQWWLGKMDADTALSSAEEEIKTKLKLE